MDEKKFKHFKIINQNVMNKGSVLIQGCGYSDAPVCTDPSKDIKCGGERYRGCFPGQKDCADSPDNKSDWCCWGPAPFMTNDNIDHGSCRNIDSPWGGVAGGSFECWILRLAWDMPFAY